MKPSRALRSSCMGIPDRKSTRLNSSHLVISYAVFCLKKKHDINVLMLAIIRNGIAIPVMWDVLGRAGNSTTAQRSALLSRFCAVFGESAIAGLIADREFIGSAWMTSLAERDIPFILRIKDTFHVRLSHRRQCQVRSLFRKVGVGGR